MLCVNTGPPHGVLFWHACVCPALTEGFFSSQSRLMSECSGSLNSVKRVSLILDDEEQPDEQGLTSLTVADKQSGRSRLPTHTSSQSSEVCGLDFGPCSLCVCVWACALLGVI